MFSSKKEWFVPHLKSSCLRPSRLLALTWHHKLRSSLTTEISLSLFWRLCCFCCSVVSDSLHLHGLQHARLPCPSPSPGVCSNACPLSQWCHPTIAPFSSCPQSFPASGSFPMSWLFASGGQSIGASASVLPTNIRGWFFRIDWFDLLAVQGFSSLLQHHNSKASIFWHSAFFIVQLYMTTGKTITFVGKVMSLLFNILSMFVIAFLAVSQCLNFMVAVTIHRDFAAQENKICHSLHFSPSYLPWSDGTRCHVLVFTTLRVLSQLYHSPLSFLAKVPGGYKVQDQGASKFSVWWKLTFWVIDICLFAEFSHGRKESEDSGISSVRTLIPFY